MISPWFRVAAVVCFAAGVHLPVLACAEEPIFVYGQFNYGGLFYDDGLNNEGYFVDANSANSRVGIDIFLPQNEVGQLRFNFETALGTTLSTEVSQNTGSRFDWDWEKTDLRKFEAIYSTNDYGRFYLGQGSMASDGVTGSDFSGTRVVTAAKVSDLSGGQLFRFGDGVLSTVSFGSVVSDYDGSRRFRARYDTPAIAGFTLSGAYGQEILRDNDDRDYYDVALRYANEFGDFKAAAGGGYNWRSDDVRFGAFSGGLLHIPSGISGSFVAGANNDDGDFVYGKFGVERSLFGYADYTTAFSVDYYSGSNLNGRNSDTQSFGLALVQNIGKNFDVYGLFRTHQYNDTRASYKDGHAFFVGARYKFKIGVTEGKIY
ncbi:MAG: porin [Rhizobiaceae bacterium]